MKYDIYFFIYRNSVLFDDLRLQIDLFQWWNCFLRNFLFMISLKSLRVLTFEIRNYTSSSVRAFWVRIFRMPKISTLENPQRQISYYSHSEKALHFLRGKGSTDNCPKNCPCMYMIASVTVSDPHMSCNQCRRNCHG